MGILQGGQEIPHPPVTVIRVLMRYRIQFGNLLSQGLATGSKATSNHGSVALAVHSQS